MLRLYHGMKCGEMARTMGDGPRSWSQSIVSKVERPGWSRHMSAERFGLAVADYCEVFGIPVRSVHVLAEIEFPCPDHHLDSLRGKSRKVGEWINFVTKFKKDGNEEKDNG